MNTNKLTVPRKYIGNEKLADAYERGFNRASGFAACNVPTLGETVLTEGMGKVTVDAENIRDVHADNCWAAESNNRQYSPFEFTCSEFNGADDEDGEHAAYFERFTLTLTLGQANDCSHSGRCDADVAYWAKKIDRPDDCTAEALRLELKEYGAWNAEELADDEVNWKRAIWLGAAQITGSHASTDSLWEAFDAGTADAISADLAGYSDSDYGIDEFKLGENAPEGFEDYQLPEGWASYLINGDASGLEFSEETEIAHWLAMHSDLGACAECSEDAEFTHRNDANNLGGNVLWFRFPIRKAL